MASSSRGGCRHGSSILRAYYVKVVRSWNAARHDSFLRRLSPRFRTNTLKAPPTLTATVAPEKLARFFQPPLSHHPRAPAIRFETRREIILLLHLARRSSSSPFFSRPFWPYRRVWIETLRVIIPGLQYGRRRLRLLLPSTSLSSIWAYITQFFYSPFYGRSMARSSRCLLSFKPLSFYLSQIMTLAKTSRDIPLSHAAWAHALSRYITSRHITSCLIMSYHGKQSRPHYTIINWRDIFFFSTNHSLRIKLEKEDRLNWKYIDIFIETTIAAVQEILCAFIRGNLLIIEL